MDSNGRPQSSASAQVSASQAATRSPRHILIAQNSYTGHRLMYVRLLADHARSKGDRVSILLRPEAIQSVEAKTHLTDHASSFRTSIAMRWQDITAQAESLGADLICIPDADAYLPDLIRARTGLAVSLLVMRPQGQSAQPLRQRLATIAKKFLRALARLRRNVSVFVLVSSLTPLSRPSQVPDPVEVRASSDDITELRADWQLSPGTYWFGVLGRLDSRKNLALVARALQLASPVPRGLLIAGECVPEALSEAGDELTKLQQAGVVLKVVDRMLSDRELDAAILSVDCVVTAHSNEGSSGIFAKGALAGVPIVAAGARSLAHDARMAPGPAWWAPLQAEALATAMTDAMKLGRQARTQGSLVSTFCERLLLDPNNSRLDS